MSTVVGKASDKEVQELRYLALAFEIHKSPIIQQAALERMQEIAKYNGCPDLEKDDYYYVSLFGDISV